MLFIKIFGLSQERLWAAIASEEIDMVVSDHSPSTLKLKRLNEGNFLTAWGGIASVQFGKMHTNYVVFIFFQ